ncbi:MAG: acyl carrier protein [Bacteroidales bacterium]
MENFISKVIEEFPELKGKPISRDSKLNEYMKWDSINVLFFIALVNVEYGVEINEIKLRNVDTVGDVWDLIEKERAAVSA